VEGLNFAAQHANEIDVVNLSLGQPGFSFPYFTATAVLVSRGVVVVAAAGNDNIDANYVAPANIPWVITVSAITDSDGKCGGAGPAIRESKTHIFQPNIISNPDDFFGSYSNFGSAVDLAAPGSRILSILEATVPQVVLAWQLPMYQVPLHYTNLFIQQLIHSKSMHFSKTQVLGHRLQVIPGFVIQAKYLLAEDTLMIIIFLYVS
jgi:hypothetical protein